MAHKEGTKATELRNSTTEKSEEEKSGSSSGGDHGSQSDLSDAVTANECLASSTRQMGHGRVLHVASTPEVLQGGGEEAAWQLDTVLNKMWLLELDENYTR